MGLIEKANLKSIIRNAGLQSFWYFLDILFDTRFEMQDYSLLGMEGIGLKITPNF